ncbi:MAG TPA: hypothetical protein VMW10_06115 [Alphaproteobacteria bacterium]|nr:hypothetical protein [Alphaproteobacteria bacterium]
MLSDLIRKYDKRIRDIVMGQTFEEEHIDFGREKMRLPIGVYIKKTPCDEKSVKVHLIENLVRPAIYEKDGFFVRLWKIFAPTWMFKIIYDRSQKI